MSGEFNRSETNANGDGIAANGSSPTSPAANSRRSGSIGAVTPAPATANSSVMLKQVEDVMYSDIGITTLLNRLKQSIASARDFAAFLKKRSSLEEEQAQGLRRLAKSQLDILRRGEVKTGSYASQLAEVMKVHERMGENGMQFALSLHQMHEDLNELSANMERGRKQWKHEGLDAEKRASDAESAMQKAKTRYDSLAEDYDRARTGDTKGSRRIGLKGPKSAEQYEQDLLRKTQAADAEYEERVKQARSQRDTLLKTERPKAVKALQELIKECDSALTLQLQKFATFNEKLLLGNGLAVTPLTDKDTVGAQRSLRDIIYDIDNETDFNSYMRGHASKIPARASEIKYEQHPTLMPKTQKPLDTLQQRQASGFTSTGTSGQQAPSLSVNTSAGAAAGAAAGAGAIAASQTGSGTDRFAASGPPQRPSYGQPPSSSGGYGSQSSYVQQQNQVQSPTGYGGPPSLPQQQSGYSQSAGGPMRDGYSAGGYNSAGAAAPPYPTHPADRNASNYSQHQHTPSGGQPPRQYTNPMSPGGAGPTPTQPNLPPLRPVFGVSLAALFDRDQSAVPLLVGQCILAVDTFGLDMEGIYRQSGSAHHIQALKAAFDHNSSSPNLDFRNPANFFHDINAVATLLKQFFRDLPDPLFTQQHYGAFMEAATVEDENQRRDALHQLINDLPDPNYATLRSLVLHLNRVMQNESRNRMTSGNLAVCFAPSLMGTQSGPQIADAGLQARVLDTILVNATAIFDED